MLQPEARVSRVRRDDDGVHGVIAAISVVEAVAVVDVGGRSTMRKVVRCEMRSKREMGHKGEAVAASVTIWMDLNDRNVTKITLGGGRGGNTG